MAGLMRFLYWCFIAYLVYAALRFLLSLGRSARSKQAPRSKLSAGVMVKDEMCDTYLPSEDALREFKDGQEHFFCSQECRRKFLENRKTGDKPASPVS